jgi:signal transduction histidine kinase/DNA-binding response OmpR family regulator
MNSVNAAVAPNGEWADPIDDLANVLVVDDLPEKLLVFGTVLEELGQNLVFVRSGRDALREVLQREFAVILLDVNMPELDGFETAELIRGYQKSAHTPIIFITSYADEMQTARGYALGAVDYILSPVVPEVLRSKVRAFVSLHAMRRQMRRQADERAALLAAEAARHVAQRNDERSAFLADASRRLGSSLELPAAVQCLAALVVPRLAALALVVLADNAADLAGDGLAAVAPPARKGAARAPGAAPALTSVRLADLAPPLQQALQRAAAERCAKEVAPAALEPLSPDTFGLGGSEHAQPLAPRAIVALPLLAGQRVLGALLAVETIAIDQPLLDDLAGRAATAFENARLYSSLQSEIVERRAAEAELQQANRRKDEFLAMLSHELRNPLAAIHYALDVVRRLATTQSRIGSATAVMQRQLNQITRLIDELLDLARISQDKIVLHHQALDLKGVIAQSVEAAQPFIGERGQQLSLALPDAAVPVEGDPARLTQIVSNLLHNASKFSPKGAPIELRCSIEDDGAVQVCVRDHGIGIDAELLPRIFDLFEQGARGLDRMQGGLGMGLTLALRLARMHGGTLEAASDGRDRGAEFRLRLPPPARPAALGAPAPQAVAAVAAESTTPRRVLVVDDNLDAARSITALLELQGHAVATAADGEQALARAAEFAPEVVILDVGLPLLDGYEVARRLRASSCPAMLVAVTGYGQARDRAAAQAAGFDHHFVKPADPATLAACVAAYQPRAAASADTAAA